MYYFEVFIKKYSKILIILSLFLIISKQLTFAENSITSKNLFNRINQKRVSNNRNALEWDDSLEKNAILRAQEISQHITLNNISTFKPQEEFFRVSEEGIIKNGEIFYTGKPETTTILKEWIGDKDNAKRFLNKYSKYSAIGISRVNIEGTETVVIVQNFGNDSFWNVGKAWLTSLFGRCKCL